MSRPQVPKSAKVTIFVCTLIVCGFAASPMEAGSKSAKKPVTQETVTKNKEPKVAAASAISLCPMRIANPPPASKEGAVLGGPIVTIRSAHLLLAPATNACFSSGYGPRNGKLHRGVDYHTRTSGDALAAGDGIILEIAERPDYGNMIVIDHGDKVYTRYAHLATFAPGMAKGAYVKRGQILGPIGATGATTVKHLHFEILSGAYVSGVGTFGLSTFNPFDLPKAKARKGA